MKTAPERGLSFCPLNDLVDVYIEDRDMWPAYRTYGHVVKPSQIDSKPRSFSRVPEIYPRTLTSVTGLLRVPFLIDKHEHRERFAS